MIEHWVCQACGATNEPPTRRSHPKTGEPTVRCHGPVRLEGFVPVSQLEELHIECGIAQGNVTALRRQLEGAVEAMELARIELDTALHFLDDVTTFKGKRSVRLCITRARHFIGGQ